MRQRVWYALRRSGSDFRVPNSHVAPRTQRAVRPITPRTKSPNVCPPSISFRPLSTDELRQLAKATVGHVFAPGETLIRAGDEGSSMFVVHNGRVAVQVSDRGGPRTVAELTEGNFFGEMALFTGEPRTANVVAIEETEVLEIGHAAMKHVFDTNPSLAESISWTIAERQADLAEGLCLCPAKHSGNCRPPLLNQAILRTSLNTSHKASGSQRAFFACAIGLLLIRLDNTRLSIYYARHAQAAS